MRYRDLGRTGLKVSAVGVGTMMFGWRTSQAEADKIVASAIDSGVNFFDTSCSYGRGESERVLGLALRQTARRDCIILATKCGSASEETPGPNGTGNSRHNIIRQCELSLKRLQVDYIDLLQLHYPSTMVPIEESFFALERLVQDGKVRYVGTSNFSAWQIVEGLWRCEAHRLISASTEQFRFNIIDSSAETDIRDVVSRYRIGAIVYSPLAEGLLTGKYRLGTLYPVDSRFFESSQRERYASLLTPRVDSVLNLIGEMACSLGVSMVTLAIAWILQKSWISTVLVGPSCREHLEAVLQAVDLPVKSELMASLDAIGGTVNLASAD